MMISLTKYENKALIYADKHGIIEYKLNNNKMIYHEKWFNGYGWIKYECTLDLNTMEESRIKLS